MRYQALARAKMICDRISLGGLLAGEVADFVADTVFDGYRDTEPTRSAGNIASADLQAIAIAQGSTGGRQF